MKRKKDIDKVSKMQEAAKEYLANKAYGDKYGARDLRNLIRKEVEDKIAGIIVDADGKPIKSINLTATDQIITEVL